MDVKLGQVHLPGPDHEVEVAPAPAPEPELELEAAFGPGPGAAKVVEPALGQAVADGAVEQIEWQD